MTGVGLRTAVIAVAGALVLAGCGTDPADPSTSHAPAYCAATDSGDDSFWAVVHESCAIAQDGDTLQADALRQALEDEPVEDIAEFHRTLVRLNHALQPSSDVSDDICASGPGLGEDLGTDYRSWIIAHGQSAYDAVLADPNILREFPDAEAGCGLGEPFGATGADLYLERTGLGFEKSGLPVLEAPTHP